MRHPMNQAGLNFQGNLGRRIEPMPFTTVDMLPQTLIADAASAFRGDPSAFLAPIQLQQQQQAQSGALTQNPGLLSSLMEMMPQAPTQEFDPRNALMAGALSGLSDIILKRPLSDRPMQLMNFAQQRFDRDQARDFQQQQANFQNTLGLGQLMATLAKDTSPNDIKIMRLMGLDPTDMNDVKKYFQVANQGKGTNVTIDPLGGGNSYMDQFNKASAAGDVKFLESQTKVLLDNELSKIEVLDALNNEITDAGGVGDLKQILQNAATSLNFDIEIDPETGVKDLYRQVSNTFVLDEAARQTGALSDGDIILFRSVTTNLDKSPQGRVFATAFMKATAKRRRDVAKEFAAWAEGRLRDNKPPSKIAWIQSEQFKNLREQSLFDSNPELLVQIHAASTTTANKRKIIDMRIDQLEKQGITDEAQIADIMRQEGF